jgi:DNA-binding response OmpR family regulator
LIAGLREPFWLGVVKPYGRPEVGVVGLRHLAEPVRLRNPGAPDTDLIHLVYLFLQIVVGFVEVGSTFPRRTHQGKVAVLQIEVEDGQSQIVALILQPDVVLQGPIGNAVDPLVEREFQCSHEGDHDEQPDYRRDGELTGLRPDVIDPSHPTKPSVWKRPRGRQRLYFAIGAMKILLVEDDAALVRALRRGLSAHGHELLSAENGEDGVAMAWEEAVDFVLLDISLPGLDGQEVLRRIRALQPELPVLMLTARDDLLNKVTALNAGADDYLTKPFEFEELLARIRALTRRTEQPESVLLKAGDLRIDLLSQRAWRGDKSIELSSREFALLEHFMRHRGQVLSRGQLLSAIWDYSFDTGSNVVSVYVTHLRRKIDRPGEPSLINTVRGAGYRFEPPGDY